MTKDKTRYKYGDVIIRERKGKYYVYILRTINGKLKETYVGPLTDVVETYIKLKENGGVGESPTMRPPGFEPGTAGSGGPSEKEERRKIGVVANLRSYATDGNLKAFYEYLINERRISEETAKEYINALRRKYTDSRNSQKAYRLFAKFLASRGIISEEFADKVLKIIKVKSTKADLYVPTIEQIKQTLQLAKEYSENVYTVYRLALESGARLSEILKVLREPERDITDGDIHYYPISWTRGYKGSFYLFHITPLRKIEMTHSPIAKFERKYKDAVKIKYIRKFVATQMAQLGIPLDVIDFIQGRKPIRVATQHYVSLFGVAKEHYKKYVEWLKNNINEYLPAQTV
ncbi:integrase [Sulfolobus spindle-shaped virus]|nr:integrase [Sulfolobus spindle-shaped virus]